MVDKKRECLSCSHWEPDFYEETHQEMAGYCSREKGKILLKYESQSCASHRFKRGAKSE